MKRQNWYRGTRYLLVGMLVATMTVDCAATIRLFRKRCDACVCRPVCRKTVCRKTSCRKKCSKHSCTIPTVVCHTYEPVADTTCHGCAAAAQLEMVTEEHIVPAPAPVEMNVPEVVEQDPLDESMFEPIDPPANQAIIPPAPVAVPEAIAIPTTPAPTIVSPPEAGIVGDRYSNESDPVGPPAPEVAPTPAPVADPAPVEDPLDLFDEPTPTVEESAPMEPEEIEPAREDPQPEPELDDEGLFGPAESSDTEKPDEQPVDTQQPEPVEPNEEDGKDDNEEDSYDPFGENLFGPHEETAVLSAAGGLHSEADRTWTDNSATFQCKARLVHVTAKSVVLHRDSGAKLVVPYARLGQADLLFVQQQVIALRVAHAREGAAEKLAVAWAR